MHWRFVKWPLRGLVVCLLASPYAQAACCYFSATNTDILQPAQKVFITWDPKDKVETFTVQPKFEGNAVDFGMVIPTPSQPKLNEMPRDFFKHLAVYTIMRKRDFPQSQLLPLIEPPPQGMMMGGMPGMGMAGMSGMMMGGMPGMGMAGFGGGGVMMRPPPVKILEVGTVGSLDYKIIEATRADDLHKWLKDNKYSYAGDEATLNHYVQKKWFFTVMKIDTAQMKRNKDGSFSGEVTPTRFRFTSDKLVYPLKITQISVREKTEALFYVQAPFKVDLPGDMTYQYTWVPMLDAASGCTPGGLPGQGARWLAAYKGQIPPLLARARELEFAFVSGQRPAPNKKGHFPTTMEWARKLSKADIAILTGDFAYSEVVPNPDAGFTLADAKEKERGRAIAKVIRARLDKAHRERPFGYLVREAPADDVRNLQQLAGHLSEGLFITKFRKLFARDEMNDDLLILPARYQGATDTSEYEEILPTSPP